MKLKEEILKMSKEELYKYKYSEEIEETFNFPKENINCSYYLGCSGCSDCSYCSDCLHCSGCSFCSDCSDCSDCSFCYMCRNSKGLKYAICNMEVSKEEYEVKMKELKGQN